VPAGSPDRRSPLVFAHRGSSAAVAEHTLGAYLRAIDEGADGLECDVRLTRDGHLVCLHDRRINRTSDGRGLVSSRTLAELDRLDFGSWHPGLPETADDLIVDRTEPGDGSGERNVRSRVLTFDRLLDAALAAGRSIEVLVETKHPSRYGGAVEEALVVALRRYGLATPEPDQPVRVTVMSFSPLAVRRIRRLAPQVPTVLLLEFLPPGLRAGLLPFGTPIGGPGIRLVRAHPEVAVRLRERGYPVYVWTVNEPADLDLVLSLQVEGIISDRPGFVVSRLRELGLR